MTRATNVRRLTWGALAVAAAAWIAVIMTSTPVTTPLPESPSPVADVPAPTPDAMPVVAAEPAETPDVVIDRDPVPVPKPGPEKPAIERGTSTLVLHLRDADTGKPADAEFVLWRLGVDADEFWSAGDQVYSRSSTVSGVVHIARLPEGRYRVCCDDQRRGSEDPPEFAVGAGVNEIERAIRSVRSFHVRLIVVDDAGTPVASGSLRHTGGSGQYGSGRLPAWASPRSPLWQGAVMSLAGPAHADGIGERTGHTVNSVAGVFDLVTFRESSRNDRSNNGWEFTPPCGERIRLSTNSDSAADVTFTHVVPRPEALVAHVTGPDGAKLDSSTVKIDATCQSVRCAWPPPADAWRTIPVHVKIVKDGCEPLSFDWTAATADAEHRLVAIAPESPK